jgi:Sulfatase-modifying factor enzyme 1
MNTFLRKSVLPALTGLALLAAQGARANNIQVTNATLTGDNGTSVMVQFDVSWENSWRGVGMPNWDAAWIFVKWRNGAGVWQHANLNSTGHTAPVGSTIDGGLLNPALAYNATTNPAVGVFIRRSADGTGTFTLTGVQLNWPYAAQGIAYPTIAQAQVFGIEMVYAPQGAFFVGSGGTEPSSLTNGVTNLSPSVPYQISSEGAINAANTAGSIWGIGSTMTVGTVPAAFPKGFNAFYCMKYETSQQGYVDFLNTLDYTAQTARTALAPNSAAGTPAMGTNFNRQNIDIQTPGVASTTPAVYACNANANGVYGEAADGKDVVMNYMNVSDLLAYLDWSGLRPMTELEYEKACRGTNAPLANEYAWGTATAPGVTYTLANTNLNNEGIATGYSATGPNHSNNSVQPLRVGIFAAHAGNSSRQTSGATIYGIMEMTESVCEPAVNAREATGRSYTGQHGNGALAAGLADAATWNATVMPWRGGFFGSPYQVSQGGACSPNSPCTTNRDPNTGGRGVRTAP